MQKILNHVHTANLKRLGGMLIVLLLALVPFHALFVVWGGSVVGRSELLSIWKELLIIFIVGLALAVSLPQVFRKGWREVLRQPSIVLVGLILLAGLLANLLNASYGMAFFVGIKTTAVPLVLFLAVQPFAHEISEHKLARIVLGSACVVAILALVQFFLVPTSFLASIGYGESTILPFQGVHPEFPFGRSFSTLGGPNQLGTYLIVPFAVALAAAVKARSRKSRLVASLLVTLFVTAAITTFSRSALIGFGVATAVVVLLAVPKKYRLLTVLVFLASAAVAALVMWGVLTNDNSTILDRFLVRGELTPSGVLGGDEGHIAAIVKGYATISMFPGGLGFGTAGPASFYAVRPLLTENWYLQIAIEIGLIGLALMLLLLAHIVRRVRQHGIHDPIRIGYAAAVLGIMVSALFLHSLADSTLAILLFGMGGLLYASRAPKGNQL
ncbi:MAG: hypothetical protein QG658_123 [Patescibacteria group bacterium]|nr:hypothetical protein [Patescibacteria group bacterium]